MTDAHKIARCIRGCTTDAQYQELTVNIEATIAALERRVREAEDKSKKDRRAYVDASRRADDRRKQLIAAEREAAALREVLQQLVEACDYVSPIAGAVATEAKVKHIREAGRFVEAVEKASALLDGGSR